MPQGTPRSGELYRHFKDKLYQIVTVAKHSETGEPLVIYQALYGDFSTYARPLAMFISEVDREKYPNVEQKYRFQLVEREGCQEEVVSKTESTPKAPAKKDITDLLMDFYDADTYEERYKILTAMREDITDVMINNMAVVLDVVIPEGPIENRYEELKQCLRTYQKYEINRR